VTITEILIGLLVFVAAALDDILAAWWYHYVNKGSGTGAGTISVIHGAIRLCGIGAFIEDWRYGLVFVLGNGVGSYLAITYRARLMKQAGNSLASRKDCP
jgi:hypothetical protein